MQQSNTTSFGKIRGTFWPVYSHELKKVLPMLLIAFCIAFNYTVLRDTKDTIVVSAIDELALPFLKLFGTLPMAVLYMLFYTKMSNILSREKLFYVAITPFIVFFALFATVLYPMREALQPTELTTALLQVAPEGFYSAIKCFEHWTLSLFYILSELWGSAVLSLMFWAFANEIVKTMEAKRFYTLFTLGFNLALVFSGPLIWYFSKRGEAVAALGGDPWQASLNYLMGMVVISGIVIVAAYRWMTHNVLTDPLLYNPDEAVSSNKKSKPKMGIIEGLVFIAKSPYLICITLMVIGYGMSINLVEVVWKGQLKLAYPTENEYSAFMGLFSLGTGVFTIMMTFVGGYIIRNRSFRQAASITPMALLITGIGFFTFTVFKTEVAGYLYWMGTTPLMMAVIIGMLQNIASKSTKYALFDPTKEMAYIPLSSEVKLKGKAAIDVVGARLGKSGGALIWNVMGVTLVSLFGKEMGKAIAIPIVGVLMVLIIMAWLTAVRSLSRQYNQMTGEDAEDEAPIAKPAKNLASAV